MFILVDGIMGSGKTYYAVDYIKKNHNKYYKVLNNINGFKYQDNIQKLYFDVAPDNSVSMLDHFDELKSIYDRPETDDNDLIDYMIQHDFIKKESEKIIPLLMVIDEAQNYFNKKDELLIWVQTYHRHFYCDFILITQSYNLIYSSYLKQFEYFVHSIPLSRKLIKNGFSYQKHISVPYRDGKTGTKFEDVKLKHNPDVFAMYQSGDKVRVKSVFRKYFVYILIFALLFVSLIYFMFNYFFSPSQEKKSIKQNIETHRNVTGQRNVTSGKRDYTSVNEGDRYLRIKCFGDRCIDEKLHIDFKIQDMPYLLEQTGSKFLRSEVPARNYVILYMIATVDFFNLFEGASNENKGLSLLPGIGSSASR